MFRWTKAAGADSSSRSQIERLGWVQSEAVQIQLHQQQQQQSVVPRPTRMEAALASLTPLQSSVSEMDSMALTALEQILQQGASTKSELEVALAEKCALQSKLAAITNELAEQRQRVKDLTPSSGHSISTNEDNLALAELEQILQQGASTKSELEAALAAVKLFEDEKMVALQAQAAAEAELITREAQLKSDMQGKVTEMSVELAEQKKLYEELKVSSEKVLRDLNKTTNQNGLLGEEEALAAAGLEGQLVCDELLKLLVSRLEKRLGVRAEKQKLSTLIEAVKPFARILDR